MWGERVWVYAQTQVEQPEHDSASSYPWWARLGAGNPKILKNLARNMGREGLSLCTESEQHEHDSASSYPRWPRFGAGSPKTLKILQNRVLQGRQPSEQDGTQIC